MNGMREKKLTESVSLILGFTFFLCFLLFGSFCSNTGENTTKKRVITVYYPSCNDTAEHLEVYTTTQSIKHILKDKYISIRINELERVRIPYHSMKKFTVKTYD